jgi:hypothetical protein
VQTTKYLLTTVILVLILVLSINTPGHSNAPQPNEDIVNTCNSLAHLSRNSRKWAEVIAYKNAFDFAKLYVNEKSGIAESEKYFQQLASNNSRTRIIVCMYLDREPKNNCGFRNQEADSLLEIIEKKMKKDRLSTEDIINAIENAKPRNNSTPFTPFKKNK